MESQISITITKETLELLYNEWKSYIINENIGYVVFHAKKEDQFLTIYRNDKNDLYKAVYQGSNIRNFLKLDEKNKLIHPIKYEKNINYLSVNPQIGSDEVGTGDFLGPVVVCAAYADEETLKLITEFGITDSKKLTDEKILDIIPKILPKISCVTSVLSPEKYNHARVRGYNLNNIKAIMHNKCLNVLHIKHKNVNEMYIDKFCDEDKYFEYLSAVSNKEANFIIEKIVSFHIKGELHYPSVALASCIARYRFFLEIKKLENKYKVKFPLGAGKQVDNFCIRFIKKFGIDELNYICKKNFSNYKRICNELHIDLDI